MLNLKKTKKESDAFFFNRVANNISDTTLYPSATRSISFRQLPASLSDKIYVY